MSRPTSFSIVMGAALLLVIGTAALQRRPASPVSVPSPASSNGAVPAFTSASFADGDPIRALGPEWTFVRQTALTEKDGPWLPGTLPVRESFVKLVGKQSSLLLRELTIRDRDALDRALHATGTGANLVATRIAERDGFLVPMNDAAGGTGFAIIGNGTVLLLQHGVSYQWPTSLEPEILSYIANVTVL